MPTLPLQQRAQGIAEALPALARLSGSIVAGADRFGGRGSLACFHAVVTVVGSFSWNGQVKLRRHYSDRLMDRVMGTASHYRSSDSTSPPLPTWPRWSSNTAVPPWSRARSAPSATWPRSLQWALSQRLGEKKPLRLRFVSSWIWGYILLDVGHLLGFGGRSILPAFHCLTVLDRGLYLISINENPSCVVPMF